MNRILPFVFIFLIVSMPVCRAESLTEKTTNIVAKIITHMVYSAKEMWLGLQVFFFSFIDLNVREETFKELTKTASFHRFSIDKIDNNCMSYDCYIDGIQCTSLSEDCEKTEEELEKYFE